MRRKEFCQARGGQRVLFAVLSTGFAVACLTASAEGSIEGSCTDQVDNDADGDIDELDSGCAPSDLASLGSCQADREPNGAPDSGVRLAVSEFPVGWNGFCSAPEDDTDDWFQLYVDSGGVDRILLEWEDAAANLGVTIWDWDAEVLGSGLPSSSTSEAVAQAFPDSFLIQVNCTDGAANYQVTLTGG